MKSWDLLRRRTGFRFPDMLLLVQLPSFPTICVDYSTDRFRDRFGYVLPDLRWFAQPRCIAQSAIRTWFGKSRHQSHACLRASRIFGCAVCALQLNCPFIALSNITSRYFQHLCHVVALHSLNKSNPSKPHQFRNPHNFNVHTFLPQPFFITYYLLPIILKKKFPLRVHLHIFTYPVVT